MGTESRFTGSIPELYDRHMGPTLFEPYARDIAQRVPPTALRILELAAGTGRVTRHLLAALPAQGALVVTDLNEPMLAIAKQNVGLDARVTWQAADMQALPLADGSIDAIVCQFGLMFVPDKPRALREMKRVLTKGGILLLSTWGPLDDNPAQKVWQQSVEQACPVDPPRFVATPFSMTDGHELERLAVEAGFTGSRVDTVVLPAVAESAAYLAHGFARGNPLWNQLSERGIDAGAFERRMAGNLAAAFGEAPLETTQSAHVLTAWA